MSVPDEIFSAYYKDIYRYLYSLCRDVSLAEDLSSEVFLEVVKSISSFRAESDVKTWLFSIARFRWLNYLRRKKRTIQAAELDELTEREHPNTVSAEKTMLDRELIKRIYAIINEERERPREVALLRIDGYSFYEIGRRLGISENSARVIFFRTREKIRETLKKEGLYNE